MSILKSIFEKTEKIPLYSAFLVSDETSNEIDSKIDIKDFNDEYHTTLCYSKKPVLIDKYFLEKRDFDIKPVIAKVNWWTIFESETYGKSFVLKLDCEDCFRKFEEFIEMGASYDYDEYIPHLTLCYDLPDDINPKDVFEKVKDLEIVFDRIRYEKIDEEKYLDN